MYNDFLTTAKLFLDTISFVLGQIFWALLVLFHSVTLFMTYATTNL